MWGLNLQHRDWESHVHWLSQAGASPSYCCLHYWRTVLPDTEFLVDISSFSTLNTSVHYFLVPIILYEKSISLIKDPLYARSHYSCCCFQDFLFVIGFWQLTIMCLIVGLFENKLLGVRWVSWIYRFHIFHQILYILVIISPNILPASYFLPSPSGTTIIQIMFSFMLSHRSFRLYSLFFTFFLSLLRHKKSLCPTLDSLILSSACPHLMLHSSSIPLFFNISYYTFQLQNYY